MDSGGRIYESPSQMEKKALGLKPINRPITAEEKRTGKIGRNSPCGCGSGVKFKKCCYSKKFDFESAEVERVAHE